MKFQFLAQVNFKSLEASFEVVIKLFKFEDEASDEVDIEVEFQFEV